MSILPPGSAIHAFKKGSWSPPESLEHGIGNNKQAREALVALHIAGLSGLFSPSSGFNYCEHAAEHLISVVSG